MILIVLILELQAHDAIQMRATVFNVLMTPIAKVLMGQYVTLDSNSVSNAIRTANVAKMIFVAKRSEAVSLHHPRPVLKLELVQRVRTCFVCQEDLEVMEVSVLFGEFRTSIVIEHFLSKQTI